MPFYLPCCPITAFLSPLDDGKPLAGWYFIYTEKHSEVAEINGMGHMGSGTWSDEDLWALAKNSGLSAGFVFEVLR